MKPVLTVRVLESQSKYSNLVPILCSMFRVPVESVAVKVKGLVRRTVASNAMARR